MSKVEKKNTNVYCNLCPLSPEFLLLRAEPVLSALENLNTSQTEYTQNQTGKSIDLVNTLVIAKIHIGISSFLILYKIK